MAGPEVKVPEGQQQAEAEDLWGQLLADSVRKAQQKEGSVIVVGDRRCGKKVLLSQMRNRIETANSHFALNYSFINIRTEDEIDADDVVTRLHLWQVNHPKYMDLLQSCIKPKTFPSSMFMIILDFSRPWSLMSSLQEWLRAIEEECKKIMAALPLEQQQQLRDQNRRFIQSYQEPRPASSESTSSSSHTQQSQSVSIDVPLPDNSLLVNLGIPLLVVCNKSDTIKQIQEGSRDGDFRLDYIQQQLRQVCLKYGASLVYTSAKERINCELLQQYMLHRLFGMPFEQPAEIINKQGAFVPAGWDSMDLIQQFFDYSKVSWTPDTPYEKVIVKPSDRRKPAASAAASPAAAGTLSTASGPAPEMTVIAEDDQKFLQRHKQMLETGGYRASSSIGQPLHASLASLADSPARKVTPVKKDGAAAAAGSGGARKPITPLSSGDLSNQLSKGEVAPSVLAKFFQDLLARDESISKDKASSSSSANRKQAAAELDRMKQENANYKKGSPQ